MCSLMGFKKRSSRLLYLPSNLTMSGKRGLTEPIQYCGKAYVYHSFMAAKEIVLISLLPSTSALNS